MKYALTHNGIIKVGPRDWHTIFFDKYLKTQEIDFKLPLTYDSLTAIEISPTVKIVAVEEPAIPSHDSITEQLSGPFYNSAVDPITGYYDIVDIPLDAVKNKMLAIVAEERYKRENTIIPITVQGQTVTVDTSRGNDREIWVQSLVLLPTGATQTYKFPNEQIWLTLTIDDIKIVIGSIMQAVQGAFAWEGGYTAAIAAATTKQQLQDIYLEIIPPVVTGV